MPTRAVPAGGHSRKTRPRNCPIKGRYTLQRSGDELLAGSAQFAYLPVPRAWVFFVWARLSESLPVSMMLPPKVSRSTIAAQSADQ